MKDLVIVGCGGFGREVHDIVRAINAVTPTWNLLGFVDDGPQDRDVALVARLGLAVLGTTDYLKERPGIVYALAIGSGPVRRKIDDQLSKAGSEPATLIHPTATIGSNCTIGAGTILCPGARVNTNVQMGRHVHVNPNSNIGHDASLMKYVTVLPMVAVSGWVTICDETMLGTHSCVLPGLRVGASCQVGAGAVVVSDVPDDTTVKGVPAR